MKGHAARAGTPGTAHVRARRSAATTTGIVRHIDELGRIVIPIEIRKRFGLTEKDPLEITVRNDSIVLSRPQDTCVFCGRSRSLVDHRGRAVCEQCVSELRTRG